MDIQQDNQTTAGRIRLENYRLSKWDKFVSNAMKFFGISNIEFIRSRGELLWDTGFVKNTITTVGKAAQGARVAGLGSVPAFTYLATGSSNTAPAIGQTALGSEYTTLGMSRVNVTPTQITTAGLNDTIQLQNSFNVSGTVSVEEMGIFNNTVASGTSIMLGRALTGTKAATAGDTMIGTYTVQYL